MLFRIFISALFLILSGCASNPRYSVAIDSYAKSDVSTAKTFRIANDKDQNPNDFQFIEFSRHIEKALSAKGLQRNDASPDISVYFSYSISEPREVTESYSIPIFGQTGVSSSSTYGSVVGNTFQSSTIYTPTYGVTGFQNGTTTSTFYTRTIVIDAMGANQNHADFLRPLWKTRIVSSGPGGDLRVIFPYMLSGALPYIGTNTGKIILVDVPVVDKKPPLP